LYLAQDGSFDTTTTATNIYGAPSGNSNAGAWQINVVQSITPGVNNVIVRFECDLPTEFASIDTFSSGITTYYRAVMTQFIIADTLTINTALSAPQFTSATTSTSNIGGGVVAVLANSIQMTTGSSISADQAGFVGGAILNQGYRCNIPCGPACNQKNYLYTSYLDGALKGSSIVPFSEFLVTLHYGRGALGNGGGGGNNLNAGGGGGANICSSPTGIWTGFGVWDYSPLYKASV